MSKSISDIKKIAIIGAGTMGLGIAQVCASAGFETLIFDINESAVSKALLTIEKNVKIAVEKGKMSHDQSLKTLGLITGITAFDQVKADLIIEAVLEKLDLKIDLFTKLAAQNEATCILASNTSSIPITKIGAAISNPERVLGMHFFNPAHIMKLVEIISGAATSPDVAKTIFDLCIQLGKQPVLAKDSPGFVVNRVARHFYVEGLKVLEEQVADFETIDVLMENIGFKMGPFKLMDLIGVDTNFSVTTTMFESFHYESRFRPNRIQQQKVDAGFHGRKSGRGFYSY